MKGVYKETAPKEYMFNGGRNWAWGELHMPDAARMSGAARMPDAARMSGAARMLDVARMSGAARMLDVARTVCGWRVCGRRLTWESARCFAVCGWRVCGRRTLAARALGFFASE